MLVFEYMQYILFRIVSYVQICCVCQFNETICYIMPEWRRYDFVVNQKLVVLFVRFDPYYSSVFLTRAVQFPFVETETRG